MSFSIFTFYTKNTPYEEEAKRLTKDCMKIGVPITVLKVSSTGSWVENTMLKPKMILKALERTDYDCLVWVDADARMQLYPYFFEKLDRDGTDFSVFQMGSKSRVTSGTIFMRNNDKVKEFVSQWMHVAEKSKERLGDQHALRHLIKKCGYKKFNIKYKPLPYTYCYIFDDSLRHLAPNIKPLNGPAVILHTQASRKYRNKKL